MHDRFLLFTGAIALVLCAYMGVIVADGPAPPVHCSLPYAGGPAFSEAGYGGAGEGGRTPGLTCVPGTLGTHVVDNYYRESGAVRERLTLDDILARVRDQGGFTYNPRYGASPKRGYAVSLQGHGKDLDPGSASGDELRQYMRENWREMADPALYVGGWADGGRLYLDISVVLQDKTEARKAGRINGQAAIFDLGTGETIDLQGPDGSWLPEAGFAESLSTAAELAPATPAAA